MEYRKKAVTPLFVLEINTLAMMSRINRLEALQAEIMAHLAILAQEEEAEVGTFLEKGLTDTYYKGMYGEYINKNPD